MGIPTDVDTEKKIAVVFGQMCAAFDAGAGALDPSDEVYKVAFNRYHDGIADTLKAWGLIKDKILDLARQMGTLAASKADDDPKSEGIIGPQHFKSAADTIEKKAIAAKMCEPKKIGKRIVSCGVCPSR